jgi:hypothetical protein
MKPLNSVITGLLNREPEASNSTGLQRGERGVATDAALAKLESQTPEDTDRNLSQWLTSSLNVVPTPQVSLTYPVTGGYQRTVTGFSFEGLTENNRSSALKAVQAAMTPATAQRCEEHVSMLHAVTAHRQDGENSLRLILRLYADCLARYPADVAKSVVERFIYRSEKPNFFPTLSELKEACDKAAAQRMALLRTLKEKCLHNDPTV